MCLTKVIKRLKPNKNIHIADKDFYIVRHNSKRILITPIFGTRIDRGKWMQASGFPINAHLSSQYEAGFHALVKDSGKGNYEFGNYRIQVLVRDVRTIGYQDFKLKYKTYVAKELFVPRIGQKLVQASRGKRKGEWFLVKRNGKKIPIAEVE